MTLIKKHRYIPFFGKKNNHCRFYFRRKKSNLFITITDLLRNTILSVSSCSVLPKTPGLGYLRKAPHTVEKLFEKIKWFFITNKIRYVTFCFRKKLRGYFHYLKREFHDLHILIRIVTYRKRVPHNGVRGKKLKRR